MKKTETSELSETSESSETFNIFSTLKKKDKPLIIIENGEFSDYNYNRIKSLQIFSFIMELSILSLSLLTFEIQKFKIKIGLQYMPQILYSIFTISILKIITLFLKNLAKLDFHKSKLFESYYMPFYKSQMMTLYLKEIFFSFFIPLPFTKEITFTYKFTADDNEIYNIIYNLNDIFVIVCIIRFLYSLTYLEKLFEYNTNSSYRIIKLLGNNRNFSFFIRCLFAEQALKTVFVILVTTTLTFAITIRIFEFDNPFADFSNFYNAIWFSFITMVTVGYGDYVPITAFGRFLSFFLGVTGVLNTYLITVILSEKVKMKINEENALQTYHHNESKEIIRKTINIMFYHLFKIRTYLKMKNSFIRERLWNDHLQSLYKNYRVYIEHKKIINSNDIRQDQEFMMIIKEFSERSEKNEKDLVQIKEVIAKLGTQLLK